MSKKYDYNVIVIGGGSAGLVSSYIASVTKAKVALVEKHKMGGDCLNTGCVPSKALLRSAKMLSYAKRASDFGFKSQKVNFEFKDIMSRVKGVIEKIAPHDSVERYTELGVDCIKGNAKIISPNEVVVDNKTISAKSIIVATGASPFIPPIKGIDNIDYLTSDNIWDLEERPDRLLVLGGGPIGAEMAQAFSRLGSKVTIVEMAPQILIREDEEVIKKVQESFKKDGINVFTNHKAKEIKQDSLVCDVLGEEIVVPFDKVVVALGRRANVKGFGLEELGIKLNNNGTISTNDFLQTNIPSIYVCGDVAGPYQFTHTAAHQAWYASVNALFSPFKFKTDYRVIPWATFTDPEVARVGLNEKDAKRDNIPYDVTVYGIDDLDRAIADSEDNGFVKVLTVPKKDKILGVTIVGTHAGDLIAEYILAMKYKIGLNKILKTIHIYPTLTEANKYVAGEWRRKNTPSFALGILEKFHTWRRKKS